MNIIRWIASGTLILFSLWVITAHFWIALSGLFKKRKSRESLVPFAGGLAGMIGMLVLPVDGVHSFCWIPPVVDLGCVPLFVAVIIDQVRKKSHCKT
jgi:hypothetical protein